ncbi:MAG: hypothetical protein KKD12_00045 [Proteobacteria bacterium]|nr:hypothetical protein [Pseudomonadota bacterium]
MSTRLTLSCRTILFILIIFLTAPCAFAAEAEIQPASEVESSEANEEAIEKLPKNPLTRAIRIDKLTLAAFEATLMEYLDEDKAVENIPTLKMLLQKPERIRERAKKIALLLKRKVKAAKIEITEDTSKAGGGSLPEIEFPTYAVLISPDNISVNDLEERLRKGAPAIIARVKDNALLLDARTIREDEIGSIVKGVHAALY